MVFKATNWEIVIHDIRKKRVRSERGSISIIFEDSKLCLQVRTSEKVDITSCSTEDTFFCEIRAREKILRQKSNDTFDPCKYDSSV